jgi:hypothetical protein
LYGTSPSSTNPTTTTWNPMQESIEKRAKQLKHFEKSIQQDRQVLDQMFTESQEMLPMSFLFERNLKDFCRQKSILIIRKALKQFEHRLFVFIWKKWLLFVLYQRNEEKKQKALQIQKVYRGYRIRKQFQKLHESFQKLQKEHTKMIQFTILYRNTQATKIQCFYKKFVFFQKIEKKQKMLQSIVLIQRSYRTMKLRKLQIFQAFLFARQIHASILIQKNWRRFLKRNVLKEKKKILRQEKQLELILNETKKNQWRLTKEGAFYILRRFFQPFLNQKKIQKHLQMEKKQKAANQIVHFIEDCFQMFQQKMWWSQFVPQANILSLVSKKSTEGRKRRRIQSQEELLKKKVIQHAASVLTRNFQMWHQKRKYHVILMRQKKINRQKRLVLKQQQNISSSSSSSSSSLPFTTSATTISGSTTATTTSTTTNTTTTTTKTTKMMMLLSTTKQQKAIVLSQEKEKEFQTKKKVAAIKCIYKNFCLYKKRRQMKTLQWQQKAIEIEKRIQKIHTHAINIQKRWKGILARRFVQQKFKERHYKVLLRRWFVKTRCKRLLRVKKIQKWYRFQLKKNLKEKIYKLQQTQHFMALRIQKWIRMMVFVPKKMFFFVKNKQIKEEEQIFCEKSLYICKQYFMDTLVLSSLEGDLENDFFQNYLIQQQSLTSTSRPTTTTTTTTSTSTSSSSRKKKKK